MASKKELVDKTDLAISELVYNKYELQKAYNYYAGKRDAELFKYLEENYGIGSPTLLEFTPLLKKHVDALIGEYLGTPIIPKISCKDSDTITNITREKELQIYEGVVKYLKDHLLNQIIQFISGKDATDTHIKTLLDKVIQDLDLSFISKYEIAAQNVIEYVMQSRETDIMTKLRMLLLDLLVTGYTFFRVTESPSKANLLIEVLDPLNTFIDRNPDSIYVKDSYRVVIRKWMTKSLVLNKYGKELSKEDVKKLKENWKDYTDETVYGSTYTNHYPVIDSREENESLPGHPDYENSVLRLKMIPVYEVEWLETDDDFVMQRYNTIRIGEQIYILRGKDEHVIRSKDNPSYCSLTVDGVVFLNRTGLPYSLILACCSIQDKYDLLNFYRDSIIANSGVKGQILDLSLVPASLGVLWPERVQKWMAYRKGGTLLIDSSQEGRNDNGNAPLNTIFNGYDDTISTLAVQAILLAIDSLELTLSSITGVFRERLNGIEQRDAVTNIKQGVTNSFTITKPYYQQMDLVSCEILVGCLNLAKKTWKKGLTGTIILGDLYQKVFTALPEDFTVTDYDIRVISSTEIMLDILLILTLVPEFIKAGNLPPEILFDVITAKSLSDIKYKVLKAIKILKEENNQIQQLQQLLEQLLQQLLQTLQELEKAQGKVELLNESNIQLQQHKIQLEYQVDNFKAQTERTYRENWYDIEKRKVAIEEALLHDGNPYNDEVNMGV